ncbi:MAG: Mammalian cell entry related domain protein [Pedosphaera sp.]|nr:Mammalian cell entry related domain protein [Pedosphaera sp.]
MSKSRYEIKVGLFVLLCLVILAVLMLQFSKGTTFFRPTYTIAVKSSNAGGLRPRASVLMAGVQVGTVAQTLLSPEGTNVTIYLKIYKQYVIHRSARFVIEQYGFLGDQYISIYPNGNTGPPLEPGDVASAQEPFNLLEVARGAQGFIQRIDETAQKLNDAINDVRRLVLNEQTLTNLAVTVGTFRQVSEDALVTVQNINQLVVSNGVPAGTAISNLVVFSEQLNGVAQTAQGILNTNGPQIATAINNVQVSTAMLTNLLGEVQAGHGLAGALFKNDEMSGNFSLLASNLAVTSSNLNRLGLWRVIRGPKHPPPEPPHIQGKNPPLKQ